MRLLRPARQEIYEKAFETLHAGLTTNLALTLSCAPLLAALAIVRDPPASWPFFAVVSLVCGPALAGTAWGPALVPFFCTAAALVVAVVIALLAPAAEPGAGALLPLVRPCLYLVARRWYLAAANLVVLGLAVAVVLTRPVAGLLVVCAPLLYAVWATTRFILAPLLDEKRNL
ncbi:hypothetical protein ABZ897_41150 [Nonomuraea sp. NPDC046802]|uniref:hypothetical protein n=1 Tax=Nonomuraea sp. NPDC046802 TaxID=3154919 RepID=UPI0033EC5631